MCAERKKVKEDNILYGYCEDFLKERLSLLKLSNYNSISEDEEQKELIKRYTNYLFINWLNSGKNPFTGDKITEIKTYNFFDKEMD